MTRSLALAIALGTITLAVSLRAQIALDGGVWLNHVGSGGVLWGGEAPEAPAYPMWGYSLLAGPLQARIVVVQIALLLGVMIWWLPALTRSAARRRGAARWLGNPAVLVVLLSPWMLLATSYYSSSLSALLAWIGTWALLEALRLGARLGWVVAAGGVLGLAANVRTENLLLAALLAGGLGLHAALASGWRAGGLRAAAILFGTALAMLPWLVYTQQTLGSPRLTSTNGAGVMYLGLGVLRDNPWGAEPDDHYVHEIARARVGTHAWTAPANELFTGMVREAVTSHPLAFVRRVAAGWRLALTQGVELPLVVSLIEASEDDVRLADYLNERAKSALGLAVNQRQLAAYEEEGLLLEHLAPRHYAMVAVDYGVRGAFAVLFLALLLASSLATWRLGWQARVTWVWLAYVGTWLVLGGFVQTLPRHTTVIIPALVTALAFCPAASTSPDAKPPPQ